MTHKEETLRDFLVFALLVLIGVAGRWAQPEWCFTPIAAVTVFAGYWFARWPIAALVPIACLTVSDLLLPAYDQTGVMAVTYLAMTFPVLLGRWLRAPADGRMQRFIRWAACGLVPATLFFVVTNFAVWALKSDYDKTLAGLAECYWAAVPFYRWMLAGDLFYLAVLVGCFALAGCGAPQMAKVAASNKFDR